MVGSFGVIRVGLAVALARNFKAIRLGLVPAQNGLHDAVQLRQRSALCHHQTPPDGRGCALQLHMQLVSTTGHRRRHENTPSRSKKPPFKSGRAHAAGAWARNYATRVGMAVANYAESAALVKASAKNASAGRFRVAIKLCRAASTIAGAPQAYTSKGARSSKIIQHCLVYPPCAALPIVLRQRIRNHGHKVQAPRQAMRLNPVGPVNIVRAPPSPIQHHRAAAAQVFQVLQMA